MASPLIVGIINAQNHEQLLRENPDANISSQLFQCSVLEFRADTFSPDEIDNRLADLFVWREKFFAESPGSSPRILLTLRLRDDGGNWEAKPAAREEIWGHALEKDWVDWIDIEVEQAPLVRNFIENEVKKSRIKLLLSHHNFNTGYSPDQYTQLLGKMDSFSPDIVKFAVTVLDYPQLENMVHFSRDLSRNHPLSGVFSMGKFGAVSRVLSPLLGGPLTYGFFGEKPVVEGQLGILNLKKNLGRDEIIKSAKRLISNKSDSHQFRRIVDEVAHLVESQKN